MNIVVTLDVILVQSQLLLLLVSLNRSIWAQQLLIVRHHPVSLGWRRWDVSILLSWVLMRCPTMSVIINMNKFITIAMYLLMVEILLIHLIFHLIVKMRSINGVEILLNLSTVVDFNDIRIEVWIVILSLRIELYALVLLSISIIEVDEVVSSLYRADIINLVRKDLPCQVVLACQYRNFAFRIDSFTIWILEARCLLIMPALDLCLVLLLSWALILRHLLIKYVWDLVACVFLSVFQGTMLISLITLSSNQWSEGWYMLISSFVIQELIHHAWLPLSLTVRV